MSLRIIVICFVIFVAICLAEIAFAQTINTVTCQQPVITGSELIGIGNCTTLLPIIIGG